MKKAQSTFFAFTVAAIISGVIVPSLWLGLAAFFTDVETVIQQLFDFQTKMSLLLVLIPLTMFASYCVIFHVVYYYLRREKRASG